MEMTSAIRQEAVDFCDTLEGTHIDALVDRRLSPGIIIFAPPMQLLHMNQRAWELIRVVNEVERGDGDSKLAKGLLPRALHQIYGDLSQQLRARTHNKDWEQSETKRLIGAPKRPLLIRGFAVPDNGSLKNSRIVMILEEIGRRKEEVNEETKQRFQFTQREQAVTQCLLKGWTNKEIATALDLALPTVKEHIRHIMDKTKTNTRTGILVQVLRT